MKKNRILMPFIITMIILSIICLLYKYIHARSVTENNYRMTEVKKGNLNVSIISTGLVNARTEIDIKSEVGGKVISLPFDEGDKVKKGSVIAIIDDSELMQQYKQSDADYNAAIAVVNQSKISADVQENVNNVSVAIKREALVKAELAYKHARDVLAEQKKVTCSQIEQSGVNLDVAKLQLEEALAGSRKEEIAQKLENMNQAEITMKNAEVEYERQKQLYNSDFVAKQDLDDAEKIFLIAKSQYNSAGEEYNMALQGTRVETINISRAKVRETEKSLEAQIVLGEQNVSEKARAVETALKSLVQAQLDLKNAIAQTGGIMADRQNVLSKEAQLVKAEAVKSEYLNKLSKTKILSPIDGVIISRAVEVGDVVASQTMSSAAGTTLMNIADFNSLYATANIDEADIGLLKQELPVTVIAAAYSDLEIPGIITYIAPVAEKVQNVPTFEVKIKILPDRIPADKLPSGKSSYELIFPGMSVDVDIHIANKSDVLLLPIEAVSTVDGKHYVTVITGDNRLENREIRTGISNNIQTEIVSGVKAGEKIKLPDLKATPAEEEERGPGGPPPM
ncbi:MAG: HlyD family efflux transporter periplasmic adaptor subunit [Candidatus Eremiobacterota bacterium]